MSDGYDARLDRAINWVKKIYEEYDQILSDENIHCIEKMVTEFVVDTDSPESGLWLFLYVSVAANMVKYLGAEKFVYYIDHPMFTAQLFDHTSSQLSHYRYECPELSSLIINRRCTNMKNYDRKQYSERESYKSKTSYKGT